MKKIEKRLKKDLIDNLDVELKFDTNQLDYSNIEVKETKKFNKKVWIPTLSSVACLALTCAIVIPLITSGQGERIVIPPQEGNVTPIDEPNWHRPDEKETNVVVRKQTFSKNDIDYLVKARELNLDLLETRDELNNTYPVSEEFKNSMYNFADLSYTALDKKENISFSPYGLYSILNMLELTTDSASIIDLIDSKLGLTKDTRKQDYLNAYKTNYFINQYGTVQTYNASFQTTKYEANQEYINDLTSYGIEAYGVDFRKEEDRKVVLNWIDQRIKEENFIKEEDLISDPANTSLILLSTLYFNNEWENIYEETENDYTFTTLRGEEITSTFMNHSIISSYYDYGDYVTFKDYFYNGQKIKFIATKKLSDNIYELTKNKNLFIDDENVNHELGILDITMPQFSNDCFLNLNKTISKIGMGELFTTDQFNKPFVGGIQSNRLEKVIQKNKVAINTQGAEIKSVTAAVVKTTSIEPTMKNVLSITLQNPFIYIIYDSNDLPLFIGHVDSI